MTLQSLILCPPNELIYYKGLLTNSLKAITIKTSNLDNGCIIISEHPTENSMRTISSILHKKTIPLENITWLVRNHDNTTNEFGLWYSVHNSRKSFPFLDAVIKVKPPTQRDNYVIVPKDKFFN
jgi:hypothetical protein